MTVNSYDAREIWNGGGSVFSLDMGEFDPSRTGNEIALVADDRAVLVYWTGSNWNDALMWGAPGGLHAIAIGDFDPFHQGNEVAVVGASRVTMLTGSGSSWTVTPMWSDPSDVIAVTVGDFDSAHSGMEVAVVTGWGKVVKLEGSGTTWTPTTIWAPPAPSFPFKFADIVVGDPDSASSGDELVAAVGKQVVLLQGKGSSWSNRTLWVDSNDLRAVTVGDFDPEKVGQEVAVGGESAKVTMLSRSGSSWTSTTLWWKYSVHSIAIGNPDPSHGGNELVIVGSERKTTMLTGAGSSWTAYAMWTGTSTGEAVAIGEFDPLHPGLEVLVGGFDGSATELAYADSLSVFLSATRTTVPSGGMIYVTVRVSNSSAFVAGATVEMASSSGGAWNKTAGLTNNRGEFHAAYISPSVSTPTQVTITAKANSTSYPLTESYFEITVTPSTTPTLSASIKANPSSVKSGERTALEVLVRNGSQSFSDAAVYLTDGGSGGSFDDSVGISDAIGFFRTNYTAPLVGQTTTITVACTVKHVGFNDGMGGATIQVLPPPDNTSPSVTIVYPKDGQSVSSQDLTVSGSASDNVAVAFVEVRLDSGSWQLAQGTTQWSVSVMLVPGSNTVSARSTDTRGNPSNIRSVMVSYTPPPISVRIDSPSEGQVVKGMVVVSGTAANPSGPVVAVRLRVDAGGWQTANLSGTSWQYQWDTRKTQDRANHTISAVAHDGSTNSTIDTVTVYVDQSANRPPSCSIKSPSPGDSVSAVIAVTGVAADPDGDSQIRLIEVRVDSGTWQSASGTANWRFVWDTSSVAPGTHTIEARAWDAMVESNADLISVKVVPTLGSFLVDGPSSVDEEVSFTVILRDSQSLVPVESAMAVFGEESKRSNSDGIVTFKAPRLDGGSRRMTLTATKTGYNTATKDIEVRDRDQPGLLESLVGPTLAAPCTVAIAAGIVVVLALGIAVVRRRRRKVSGGTRGGTPTDAKEEAKGAPGRDESGGLESKPDRKVESDSEVTETTPKSEPPGLAAEERK